MTERAMAVIPPTRAVATILAQLVLHVTSVSKVRSAGCYARRRSEQGGSWSMKSCSRALVAFGALCSAGMLQATEVAVCTDSGRALLELADDEAPQHVANFLRYVDMGYISG